MSKRMKKIVVAVDGPAGAGKSTICKILADRLSITYIDTGAMYRGIAYKMLCENISTSDHEQIVMLLKNLKMELKQGRLFVAEQDITEKIRTPEVSAYVSKIAVLPEVRKKLVELQRQMSLNISVIMDGRDIGTHVLTNADFKIFLTASIEERAQRRFEELVNKGISTTLEEISRDIKERDDRDSSREFQPLRMAEDGILVDTTEKTIEEVVEEIIHIVNQGEENGACFIDLQNP